MYDRLIFLEAKLFTIFLCCKILNKDVFFLLTACVVYKYTCKLWRLFLLIVNVCFPIVLINEWVSKWDFRIFILYSNGFVYNLIIVYNFFVEIKWINNSYTNFDSERCIIKINVFLCDFARILKLQYSNF